MTYFPENWKCRENNKIDEKIFLNFNYTPVLIRLLFSRNITTREEINFFLNPTLKSLHNPKLLPNIDKAVNRLKKAILAKENILVFGDYDADGIISSVLLYNFLKRFNLDVDIYIPDRFEQGYDINLDFVKKISKHKARSLIICVDCGTNSIEVKDYINKNNTGIDIIVCDHHQPLHFNSTEKYKNYKNGGNYIIVNPKLKSSRYPFKNLSGAGVTFKLIVEVLRKLDLKFKEQFEKNYLTSLLDLVAISTIADLMPLIDENRIMVKKGLNMLKKTTNIGLKKLIETLIKHKTDINTYDIGFLIVPRLNAAGRIKTAQNSVKLLKGEDKDLEKLVKGLNLLNEKRQIIQKNILEEIIRKNDIPKIVSEQKILIQKSINWNEGVLGIVASDLIKKFNIPVILFKEKGDKLKGSGRSTKIFNLYENLALFKNLFEKFGGHEQACGISMEKSKFGIFKKEMIKIAQKKIKDSELIKKFYYDIEISFKDISAKLIKELEYLKPFGIGNPRPVFITKNCTISNLNYSKDQKHLQLNVKNSNIVFGGVIFNIDNKIKEKISLNKNISIIYNIDQTIWKDIRTTQLVILDIF